VYCEISVLFTISDMCIASYLSCSLEQTCVLRDIIVVHYSRRVLPDISVIHYSRRVYCEISEIFTTADVCIVRYLSCSLEQTCVLRDI
jgi:hypothetical protein